MDNMIDNMIDEESRLSGYSYYLHYPYYCYYHCLGYLAVNAVKGNSGFVKQVLTAATAAAVDKAAEVGLCCSLDAGPYIILILILTLFALLLLPLKIQI